MISPAVVFNPRPRIERVAFSDGQFCLLVDDALREPEQLRNHAVAQRERFSLAGFNAYPGIELPMPLQASASLDEFFRQHIRDLLGGRRSLRMNSRLAMVTVPAAQLQARQWLCHRDSAWIDPRHCIGASVLYLFDDPSLGGTSFYAPKLPAPDIDVLIHDSSTASNADFAQKYALAPAYMAGSNQYFERIGRVEAKWNRMIFYDGRTFHSGEVGSSRALGGDPMSGRLTLNGFFTCTRKAT